MVVETGPIASPQTDSDQSDKAFTRSFLRAMRLFYGRWRRAVVLAAACLSPVYYAGYVTGNSCVVHRAIVEFSVVSGSKVAAQNFALNREAKRLGSRRFHK